MASKSLSIIDPVFNSGIYNNYYITIRISSSTVDYAILDSSTRKIIALESLNLRGTGDFAGVGEDIFKIKNESPVLKLRYEKVLIIPDTSIYTIIPDKLFIEKEAREYLELNHSCGPNEIIKIDRVEKISSKNIYWLPFEIEQVVSKMFLNVVYLHTTTILIDKIISANMHEISFCNIRGNRMDLLVAKEGMLKFCNSFIFRSAEDFIYFILNVYKQHNMDTSIVPLMLSGEIEPVSTAYEMIFKYVKNVTFSAKPDNLSYYHGINELPDQLYFTLFNSFSWML